MCKVKTGVAVENLQDLQNLVTGVIFRQVVEFRREDLLSAVKQYIAGSPAIFKNRDIEQIVDATLETCMSNAWLQRANGIYLPEQLR